MNIVYSWLKDYIEPGLSANEIAAILTQIGLETGSAEEVETVKGGLKGLVIGQVLTCEKHPDSDHLSKTTVDVGDGQVLPIVCGASNVAAGQKVVVATVGTVLYDGDQSFKIKKSKIRGEASEGMICAEDEIGLGTSHDGIMVLDADAKIGTPAADYFQTGCDYVLEVDLTPNRIDAASYIGVARDLAAYLQQDKPVGYKCPDVSAFKVDNEKLSIPVEIANPEACHRYAGLTISGVEVKESPEWLQNRLKLMGLKPINNIVDVTNYVLFETGQPLHAFDAAAIKGNRVVVKTMPAGSRFVTLDEVERELGENDLMICNSEEPMCIGGVFGGLHSGVSQNTKAIFLESAWFNTVYIRKTARKHGLNTDASFRFERGTDPNGVIYALKRAALLIKEVAGGEISSNIVDVYPVEAKHFDVNVSFAQIKRLTGADIARDTVKQILHSLEIEIVGEDAECLSLKVPPYRVDVQREADVIEEILRIYGFNRIEVGLHVNSTIQYSPKPNPEKIKNTVSDLLSANGFNEIWNNSLTRASYCEECAVFDAAQTVKIFNPLSNDLNAMRQSLLFGGLEAISRNISFQQRNLRLYEFGNVYQYNPEKNSSNRVDNYNETMHLAMFVAGARNAENWLEKEQASSFYLLKSYADQILLKLGFKVENMKVVSFSDAMLEEGIRYQRGDGKTYLEIGFVHAQLLKAHDIDMPVYYADFNWDFILSTVQNNKISYSELSKFPSVRRDLALLVDEAVSFEQLKAIANKTERKLLREVDIFDVYKGDKLPQGKKSYALSFVLRDDEKTLNDSVIEKTMQKLMDAFTREAGAVIR